MSKRQFAATLLVAVAAVSHSIAAPARPKIVGVSHITVKSDSLETARKFYSGVVGLAEAFKTVDPETKAELTAFKINDKQYVEVLPELKTETESRLIRIGFETDDARKLRDYLASKGVAVPSKVSKDANGNWSLVVKDPEGNSVQFVQYTSGSIHSKNAGKHLADTRLSDHVLHVGLLIRDPAKADTFYKDILGFRPLWKGGMTDTRFDWISLLVPEGHDWIEYMVNTGNPTPQQLGVLNHVCLGTKDIQKAYNTAMERGYKAPRAPAVGRDGRWLLHLYDPNFTRTELMIRKPVEKPCCSPVTDDEVK
jgi:catechol 2,3-dioxygenase-like lactoylglutathione lyase family enzyme